MMNLPHARAQLLALNPTRAGILVFSAAALAGPWYTVSGYSVVSNTISQLAAQATENNFVMRAGFVALGLGILTDAIRHPRWSNAAFIAFGLFMSLAGLFGHKPIAPAVPFSPRTDSAHSALATLAGIAITVALASRGVQTIPGNRGVVTFALAMLCLVLPLGMTAFPAFQGLVQRVMYLCVFVWLWVYFPASGAIVPRDTPGASGRPRTAQARWLSLTDE
jgi:hypothetical protein